jgi:UDP-3-O-[3-hydroxymyristoyl] glucosamine N-acyltransferase
LEQLASALNLECRAGTGVSVSSAAPLETAGPLDLAALFDRRRLAAAQASRAGALVVPITLAGEFSGRPLLLAAAARAAFARAIALIYPSERPPAGVHASAVVAASAQLGVDVSVGALAYVGERVRLGPRSVVGPGCVILDDVEIGADVQLHPRVVIYPRTQIGDRSMLLAGAVIGAPGFGQARDEAGHSVRVPHLGSVRLGQDVEVGANSTVDRATFSVTELQDRVKLDNLVQVGHNVRIGPDSLIAAQCGLAGSSDLGAGVMFGGHSGVIEHTKIGDGAIVAAKSVVMSDLAAGAIVAGTPAIPIREWRRIVAIQQRLPELWRRLRAALPGTGADVPKEDA